MLAARPSALLRAVFARLQEEGLRVIATSPARAATRMQDDTPRLVVMDLTACATTELVTKAHSLSVPIAVLGTMARSRSAFVARALGARHVMTPFASVDAVSAAILACIQAEASSRSTLDEPFTTTLSELQEAVAQELRVGLARSNVIPREGDVELAIQSPQTVATYVRRLRAAVSRNAVEARAISCGITGEPRLLTARRGEPEAEKSLVGSRLVLVDTSVARCDAITTVLRAAGAQVFVCSAEELLGELSRIAELDPGVLLVEDMLATMARRLLDQVATETRLRWCNVIELPLAELWAAGERSIDAERLLTLVKTATADERELARRLATDNSFTVAVEAMGPARLLYAMASAQTPARVSHFESASLTRIDFTSDGLIAGAKVRLPNRETLEGALALATFLKQSSGEARLEQLPEASIVNLLAPVSTCLAMASEEAPPTITKDENAPNLARLTWSTAPGTAAGNITWSNIPAVTPEMLRQYNLADPSELLDAAEENHDESLRRIPSPTSSAPPVGPAPVASSAVSPPADSDESAVAVSPSATPPDLSDPEEDDGPTRSFGSSQSASLEKKQSTHPEPPSLTPLGQGRKRQPRQIAVAIALVALMVLFFVWLLR